jgi:HSP20 family protein
MLGDAPKRRGAVPFPDEMSRRDVDKLQEEIEELFADLWQVPRFSGLRHAFRPNLDCFHTHDPHALTVVVELPGVSPESVRVVVGERVLAIAGERTRPKIPGRVYQQMEIEYGAFERQVRLVEDIDPERAQARFEQGVLTIELPVVEQPTAIGRTAIAVERA